MIPIPEGLERRLLSSIDRWDRRECLTKGLAGALAAVLLAVGLALLLSWIRSRLLSGGGCSLAARSSARRSDWKHHDRKAL